MKAAQISQYGGPEVLSTVTDAPQPDISPDQVLVEVYAAAINPFDGAVRDGYARQMAELKFPATLGGDLAGIITKVGANVSDLKLGDEVYGQAGALSGHGSFAEFAPAAAASVSAKPANLSFIEAASLPLAGVSAYVALVETIGLKAGQKILIHGGAGGIGSLAIQLAKSLGAHVATTVAADDQDYVNGLGADVVIDYKSQNFQDEIQDYDAVFNTVRTDTISDSFKVLREGGILVSMTGQPDEAVASEHGIKVIGQFTQLNPGRLTALTKLVESGAIKPQIDKTFPLDQASEALAYLQAGGHRGKVVLVVKP